MSSPEYLHLAKVCTRDHSHTPTAGANTKSGAYTREFAKAVVKGYEKAVNPFQCLAREPDLMPPVAEVVDAASGSTGIHYTCHFQCHLRWHQPFGECTRILDTRPTKTWQGI